MRSKRVERTSNEQSVPSEHNTLISILHEVANAVLRVARCVQSLDRDAVSDLELLTMCRSLGDRLALLAPNHWELTKLLQLEVVIIEQPSQGSASAYHFIVSTGMVPVA